MLSWKRPCRLCRTLRSRRPSHLPREAIEVRQAATTVLSAHTAVHTAVHHVYLSPRSLARSRVTMTTISVHSSSQSHFPSQLLITLHTEDDRSVSEASYHSKVSAASSAHSLPRTAAPITASKHLASPRVCSIGISSTSPLFDHVPCLQDVTSDISAGSYVSDIEYYEDVEDGKW